MPESTRNMFLDHIGHIMHDVCDWSKKIHPGTKAIIKNYHFWGAFSVYHNIETTTTLSVFNVKSTWIFSFGSCLSHHRWYEWQKEEKSTRNKWQYTKQPFFLKYFPWTLILKSAVFSQLSRFGCTSTNCTDNIVSLEYHIGESSQKLRQEKNILCLVDY